MHVCMNIGSMYPNTQLHKGIQDALHQNKGVVFFDSPSEHGQGNHPLITNNHIQYIQHASNDW